MTHQKNSVLFVDGASSGNPGPGGWGAILLSADGRVHELGGFAPHTTNNKMELTAAIEGLRAAREFTSQPAPLHIYTDSTYVIRGITQWIWAWKKRGWVSTAGEPVANADLWQQLFECAISAKPKWHYVKGHSGIEGNERADQIAVAYSLKQSIRLFDGPVKDYSFNLLSVPENTDLPEQKPRAAGQLAPYSYLSLVGGTLMRHSNWKECEQRIKGRSGAKFKKAMSREEEHKIIKAWGFGPGDLPT